MPRHSRAQPRRRREGAALWRGRLSQPFLAPRCTLLLAAPPSDAATAVCFSATLLQEPRQWVGSRGDPSPASPRPAPGRATRPASASRALPAAPSARPDAASPGRRCPPAIACKGRGLSAGHRPGSPAGSGGGGCPDGQGGAGAPGLLSHLRLLHHAEGCLGHGRGFLGVLLHLPHQRLRLPGRVGPCKHKPRGSGGTGPRSVQAPQYPEPRPPPPAAALARPLLAPAARTAVQASTSRSDAFMAGERAEHSTWRGAAGRGPRARRGPDPDPVPFPARPSPGPSPLTCARLCYAGAAPGSHFIPSPQPPPGVFVQRSGAVGPAGEGGASAETVPPARFAAEGPASRPGVGKSPGDRGCRGPAGGSAYACAGVCMCARALARVCMCARARWRVRSQPGARCRARYGEGSRGDRPGAGVGARSTRVTSSGTGPGHDATGLALPRRTVRLPRLGWPPVGRRRRAVWARAAASGCGAP